MVHLSVEASGRFSSTEDSDMVDKTVHCTFEAIAAHGSIDSDVLDVIIAHYSMVLILHEREERVVDPLSRGVMIMVLVALFKQGVILLLLATAGHLISWQCVASL